MGNYRFRFSDILPNAWFYKLKDTSKSRNKKITRPTTKKYQHTSSSSSSSSSNVAAPALSSKTAEHQTGPNLYHQRKSYYFTRDLSTPPPPANDHDHAISDDHHVATDRRRNSPPRKSSKKKRITTRRNRAILSSSNNIHSSNNRSTPSPRIVSSSVSAGCSCQSTIESFWTTNPDSTTPEECPTSPLGSTSSEKESLLLETTVQGMVARSASSSCRCRSVENDIIIDVENRPLNSKFDDNKNDELEHPPPPPPISEPEGSLFNSTLSQRLHLPPIITKPTKEKEGNEPICCRLRRRSSSAEFEERNAYGSLSVKVVKEDILGTSCQNPRAPARISSISSSSPGAGGLKLRTNSPRIANKRIQAHKSLSWSSSSSSSRSRINRNRSRSRRRSVSESFAVVKSSKDPQKDFRESMVEMIVENNICASKDLEDLLACYLSLNSDQYHDLIIRVFKQIWFDIVDLHPN